ncbi:MAG TPA: DEAD/DEAH box helicase [Ramlibacter sp.]|nr:DEAD/DEAH box helicase [Ramlibacter sp.]
MSFSKLGLSEGLLQAVAAEGYTEPTPIQAQAIPAVLAGRDLLAAAQTGTGKTAAFTLPLLHKLGLTPPDPNGTHRVRTLVLVPTRELAAQVAESVRTYGKQQRHLRTVMVVGGVNINPQIDNLKRGCDILVATPGRLLDLAGQKAVHLGKVEFLVLDEADRMLDMGFIHDIKRVIALLPKQRQNLMFSATFSPDIRKLAEGLLNNPQTIDIAPRNSAAESVKQQVIHTEKNHKADLLAFLISSGNWRQTLVFTRTKHAANRLAEKLAKWGITTAALHGNKSQNARTRALADFKAGTVRVLVATDIAARGIDIDQLPHVVNYELPNVPEDYVHRIGRTGRAGAEGEAISLVCAEERGELKDIERLLKKSVPVMKVEGFTPRPHVPEPPRPPMQPRQRSAQPKGDNKGNAARPNQQGPGGRKNWSAAGRPHKTAEHLAGKSRKVH